MRKWLLLSFVFLLAFGLFSLPKKAVTPWGGLPTKPQLPQSSEIRVYFNQSHAHQYRDYRGLLRYGDDLEAQIIAELAQAHSTVDMAIHQLNLPGIAQALIACKQRGVKVRVVLEHRYNQDFPTVAFPERLPRQDREEYRKWHQLVDENGDGTVVLAELNRRDALWMLKEAGIGTIDDTADGSKGTAIMHHKFIVIDGQRVVTGSTNFTTSDIHGDLDDPATRGNVNHLIVLDSPEVAAAFSEEFLWLWGGRFSRAKPDRLPQQFWVGRSRVIVAFGPSASQASSINLLIATTLERAQQSIDFALFTFSSPEIALVLDHKAESGIQVRGALDPGFAYRPYSSSLDLWGLRQCPGFSGSVVAGVGVALIPKNDKLHHKFAIIDNKIVVTGSHNWSANADERNDENTLVIENLMVAAHFHREFERIYHLTKQGPPHRKIEAASCSVS
jgi:phosphatidylserine/phosphatidylglycerophosphate/cardiolipin synthase-like enzyme